MHNLVTAGKIILNLTATDTSNLKIPETTEINIHKAPVTAIIIITKKTGITGAIEMIMGIIKTGTAGIEMTDGEEINMIIHVTMKEDIKNIPIETGTGVGFFITGITEATEINNVSGGLSLKV